MDYLSVLINLRASLVSLNKEGLIEWLGDYYDVCGRDILLKQVFQHFARNRTDTPGVARLLDHASHIAKGGQSSNEKKEHNDQESQDAKQGSLTFPFLSLPDAILSHCCTYLTIYELTRVFELINRQCCLVARRAESCKIWLSMKKEKHQSGNIINAKKIRTKYSIRPRFTRLTKVEINKKNFQVIHLSQLRHLKSVILGLCMLGNISIAICVVYMLILSIVYV